MAKQLDNGNVLCEQCGKDFKRIGSHWAQSSVCGHPELSDCTKEILIGLLMGDGWIGNKKNENKNMRVEMISPKYLEYIDDKLGWLSMGYSMKNTAKEQASKSGLCAKEENYSDIYTLTIRAHPFISDLNEWYSSGSKVWPEDIELTPTVLKHWYCGDGHYENRKSANRMTISMSNEMENTEKVSNYFTEVGLPEPSSYSKNSGKCDARWTVEDSKELFKYMGNPLPDFEYKWPKSFRSS